MVAHFAPNRARDVPLFAAALPIFSHDYCGTSSVVSKVVSHGRYVAFQMAEVAVPRHLFVDILRLIAELQPPPVTSTA